MPNLMDIAPIMGRVKTSRFEESLDVPGISLTGLVALIQSHPELIPLMQGQAGDLNMSRMLTLGTGFTISFLATGLGCDPQNEDVRKRVATFTPEDVLTVGEEIFKQSFPGGIQSFLDRITKAADLLKESVEKGQNLMTSSQQSPEQPNS